MFRSVPVPNLNAIQYSNYTFTAITHSNPRYKGKPKDTI